MIKKVVEVQCNLIYKYEEQEGRDFNIVSSHVWRS